MSLIFWMPTLERIFARNRVKCPHCGTAVRKQSDGTIPAACPSCGKPLPKEEKKA